MKYNDRGQEMPDPTPVSLPVGGRRPETLEGMIARLVRGRVSEMAAKDGLETFEEANDFEIESDDEPLTAYEEQDMKLEALADDKRRLDELEDAFNGEEKAAKVREEIAERKEKKRRRAERAAARAPVDDDGGVDD